MNGMSELLTTGQMIDRLKLKEVAVSECGKYEAIHEIGSINFVKGDTKEKFAYFHDGIKKAKWRIVPKYVTFEEVTKAYNKGKEVKCEYLSNLTQKPILETFCKGKAEYQGSLTWYLIIEGKWTIESE